MKIRLLLFLTQYGLVKIDRPLTCPLLPQKKGGQEILFRPRNDSGDTRGISGEETALTKPYCFLTVKQQSISLSIKPC
jgi:hypothetical protein